MFINNWYAACIAERLGDEPQRVRMLGCDFVLFRDTRARYAASATSAATAAHRSRPAAVVTAR